MLENLVEGSVEVKIQGQLRLTNTIEEYNSVDF